jgi:hypothetical protein
VKKSLKKSLKNSLKKLSKESHENHLVKIWRNEKIMKKIFLKIFKKIDLCFSHLAF